MKKILLLGCLFFLLSPYNSLKSQIFVEDFDGSNTTATTTTTGCGVGSDSDYFGIVDEATINQTYTGTSGNFLGAQDHNGPGCTDGTATSVSATISSIDIIGQTELVICFSIAEGTAPDGIEDWDNTSSVAMSISIDGGASIELFDAQALGGTNTAPAFDCNGDGLGNGSAITETFTEYCIAIPGTGNSLDIIFNITGINDGEEDVAIDNIAVYSDEGTGSPSGSDPCLTATPVELISFVASSNQKEVSLTWTTATELNNSHFEIQHSIDGANFRAIDEVTGNGTTQEKQAYSYTHTTPANGTNYYRLKQVDYDGAFEYSDIRVVEIKRAGKIVINPSAAIAEITIRLAENTGDNNQIGIYDMMGRTVMMSAFDGTLDAKTIDISNLEKGYYVVRVQAGSEVFTERFMKMVD